MSDKNEIITRTLEISQKRMDGGVAVTVSMGDMPGDVLVDGCAIALGCLFADIESGYAYKIGEQIDNFVAKVRDVYGDYKDQKQNKLN